MIKEFSKLFSGYEKAYGIYKINGYDKEGKKIGIGDTIPGKIKEQQWADHLSGQNGVGIIPLCEDNTCNFAVIDIDKELREPLDVLSQKINDLNLPLVLCRSTSGRAHLYAFFAEPTDATVVREMLIEWAAILHYSDSELFPKQTYRWNEDDIGNWINLPYFGGNDSNRYCITPDKDKLTLKEFIEYANSKKISARKDSKPVDIDESGSLFEAGPPCLKQISNEGGFGDGERNNGIMNVIIYLQKRYPDDWKDYVHDYNSAMCDPRLPHDEVNRIIKSADRKEYEYKCKEAPIVSCCNKALCRRQKFGVGSTHGSGGFLEIGNITKYEGDPVFWFIEVEGKRIKTTTDELLSQAAFSRACMDHLNRVPKPMPQRKWTEHLDEKLRNLTPSDVIQIPEDASHKGQFHILVNDFCTLGNKGVSIEDILMGKPFWENGYIFFRSRDLINFLEKHRFKYASEHDIWQMLRERGADNKVLSINGSKVRSWYIKAPDQISDKTREVPKFNDIDKGVEF